MIRAALASDAEDLLALEQDCFGADAWSDRVWEQELAGPHLIDVVVDGQRVVGFAVVMLAGTDAELLRIAVLPAKRRTGVAARLLTHVRERAESDGAAGMFLEVESTNEAALGLYAAAGFTKLHQRTNYYGPDRDAVVMSLQLAQVSA